MAEEDKAGGTKKKVDEQWKEGVEKEKQQVGGQPGEAEKEKKSAPPPPADFKVFISGLGVQAMIFLGEMENPVTGRKEKELDQAKYIIDTIDILKEKTKGNLTSAEERMLDGLLYDLRMRYVRAAGQGNTE